MKRTMIAFAGLALMTFANVSQAARVEADPNKLYVVAPEQGAWMICVTSYAGEKALELARELTLEIRQRDNFPAWVYNRGEEERRKQRAEREKLKQMYPQAELNRFRSTRIEDQCAVMIGGYKDSEAARRDLEKVKKLKPPRSERLMPVLMEANPAAGNRGEIQGARLNIFPGSFVARNPTISQEKPVAAKTDPFLKQLNDGEEYSLLKCRQPWTLVVASFQGASSVQSASAGGTSFMDKFLGRGQGDVLAASAQNAHNLAEALRKTGFQETYVLHRRHDSLVAVGGYGSPDDPRISQIQQALATRFQVGDSVKLLRQPMVMEVPRP